MVVKKDGSREAYSREKLLSGLIKACEKRPVSRDQLDDLVNAVESSLFGKVKSEVRSDDLGAFVMERLQGLDEVAYVRFASVYRQFKDVNQFINEIKGILDEKTNKEEV